MPINTFGHKACWYVRFQWGTTITNPTEGALTQLRSSCVLAPLATNVDLWKPIGSHLTVFFDNHVFILQCSVIFLLIKYNTIVTSAVIYRTLSYRVLVFGLWSAAVFSAVARRKYWGFILRDHTSKYTHPFTPTNTHSFTVLSVLVLVEAMV